jgi:alpha-tubulin suppressor-like RCC1 family protein
MCWGPGYSDTPVLIPWLRGARSIALGMFHSCAILSDGDVGCWGACSQQHDVHLQPGCNAGYPDGPSESSVAFLLGVTEQAIMAETRAALIKFRVGCASSASAVMTCKPTARYEHRHG